MNACIFIESWNEQNGTIWEKTWFAGPNSLASNKKSQLDRNRIRPISTLSLSSRSGEQKEIHLGGNKHAPRIR